MIFDLSLIVKSKTWKVNVFLNIKTGFCFPFINSQGKHPGSSDNVIDLLLSYFSANVLLSTSQL